jgi:hypothetical protein
MMVRLKTEDGKIKEYKTVYGVGCTPVSLDYCDYAKWVTKCGKEWKKSLSHKTNAITWNVQFT